MAAKMNSKQAQARIVELEAALKAANAEIVVRFDGRYVAFPLDSDHEQRIKDAVNDTDMVSNMVWNSRQIGPECDGETMWEELITSDDYPVPGLDAIVLRASCNEYDGSHLCRVFGAKRIV
jgi:hypothetical protein